jgi:predicted nucleic acid-binding protein
MVLVDTSVWVEHFRRGLPELARLLDAGLVVCHPFVLGELACGNLKNRREILELLQTLCTCPVASHQEVLSFIEANHLMGQGLGYIDVHLLASAKLSGVPLWTLDRPLRTAASSLNVAYDDRSL